jgi:hypothetical protein
MFFNIVISKNYNIYMARGRRRRIGHDFLDQMIIDILRESPEHLQPLNINFKINERSRRVVGFNVIKQHLDFLVACKKIFKSEVTGNDNKIVMYWSKPIH